MKDEIKSYVLKKFLKTTNIYGIFIILAYFIIKQRKNKGYDRN